MPDYTVTGRPIGERAQQPPYNLITDQMSIGQTITLTLSTADEATLTAAGIIALVVAAHLYPY